MEMSDELHASTTLVQGKEYHVRVQKEAEWILAPSENRSDEKSPAAAKN